MSVTPSPTAPAPPTESSLSTDGPAVGLQLCDDVPPFVSRVMGSDVGGSIDPIFHGVLLTYAAEHSDTFGGLWLDREAGGAVVLAFTDGPDAHRAALAGRAPAATDVHAVEPLPLITDSRPIGEWGVPFDVVQVPHTEAQLVTAVPTVMALLQGAGIAVGGAGVDVTRSRVSIFPPTAITAGDVADMAAALGAAVPLDLACIDGAVVDQVPVPVRPGTSLDVITLPDADGTYPADTAVECDGIRFRLGALRAPPTLDRADAGLRAVLDGWLAGPAGEPWPQDGWFLLDEGDETATFLNVSSNGVFFVGAERGRHGWIWSGGGGGGGCDVRLVLPDGLGPVTWVLDPAFSTPDETTTELHLLVTEEACTGGTAPGERLLGPQLVETDSAVRIAFAVIPLTGGQGCPGNPATPITITLEQPLAGRELRDGVVVAPITDLAHP